ncbi:MULTISPECIES: hypothetical protein [unclassified Streptomyces]|uniref:hypothetical protein n=1 Tax=unclassified Streptomyces TaxID=2593676 RepID=UPI0011E7F589|nr:hypothetical protein [Streptomyces sp. sk2.1]TXS68083.1 hypothetical protein EAO76_35735 [Streptomyces sp. sk2.1]
MTDDVRNILLGVIAAGISASLGWLTRTHLWRRKLRRKQAFFGLPGNSECLLVVNRDAGGDGSVHRHDVFALLELSALVKDCSAHAQIVSHDVAQQGFGERTEFCVGGPVSNRRMAAHLHSLLPGVKVNTGPEPGPDRGAFQIGTERYRAEKGVAEHVLLARLTVGQDARPVFLFCGQQAITNQAASRYLARNHEKLFRKYGDSTFCLLLKVVNSQAYGPDVVELVADVTRAAQAPVPAPRNSHRATG